MLLRISSKDTESAERESLESLKKHEKELEEWLVKNLDSLLDQQLWPIHQESPAKSEADIIALDDAGNTFIFELKRGKADHRSIGQLFKYWTAVANMNYKELNQRAKKFYKNDLLELKLRHKEEMGLSKIIKEEKFNQDSYLIVVAERANPDLWDIITFLRSRFEIPIAFIKFDVYRFKDEELALHFDISDVSELMDMITGEKEQMLYEDKERHFWYNTNKQHLNPPSLHDEVFKINVAATYGSKIYGEYLIKAKIGDHIFAYANGEGIRAYGKVTGKWSGKTVGPDEKAVTRDRKEYHLPVKWEIVLPKEKTISPDTIRDLGYSNFRGTFRRIGENYTEFAKNLKKQMLSRMK